MSAEPKLTRYEKYLQKKDKKRGTYDAPKRDLLNGSGGDSKEKKEYLIAERVALELKERLSQLISRDFAAQKFAEVLQVIAQAFEKIPVRVCHDLAAEKDPVKIRNRLEDEVREAMLRASINLNPDREQEIAAEPEPEPGAKKKRGRPKKAGKTGAMATVRRTG